MKATFKYIVTAFAVCAALVSCQKDNLAGNTDDKPAVGNVRVIEVHFGTATKSALAVEAGLTPSFVNGDKIMASNGTSKEECTVSVDANGNASFTTSLTGALTAVYPSAAAKLNGNAIDGVIVPATQDGTFAKANIAKAAIASDATSATFINQTTLLRFYVDKSIGVKSITITAGGNANIADGSKTIVVDPEGDTTLDNVTDDPGGRICYVSVLPGTFTSLKFTSVTTTQKDYTNNTVERTASNVTLATNKIYNAFIPYYIDLGTAGKWGYCNIGAFLPEDAGKFFAWGETKGHIPATNGQGAFAFGVNNGGFADDFSNCPYYGSLHNIKGEDQQYHLEPAFTKYMPASDTDHWDGTGAPDNLTVLEAVDDAATAIWGNVWRMPKITEFQTLIESYPHNLQDFDSGFSFGTSPYTVFLPAAGNGWETELQDLGDYGMYWSSSLNTEHGYQLGPGNGNTLEFGYSYNMIPELSCEARYLGCSIRPVKIVSADVRPDDTETAPEETIF